MERIGENLGERERDLRLRKKKTERFTGGKGSGTNGGEGCGTTGGSLSGRDCMLSLMMKS